MTGIAAASNHPSAIALDAYVHGALAAPAAMAVEHHVDSCPACRSATNTTVATLDPDRLGANLAAIAAELDAPRPGVVERVIVRIGIPPDAARLLVATPSLRRSWFIALTVALLFGVSAATPGRPASTLLWFLALAPLIPVVGVALAYGPGVDPAYEVTLATPINGLRLVLIRTVAVLTTSIALTGFLTLLMVSRHSLVVAAWLVPALALTAVCLALMTVVSPRIAELVVGVGWLALIIAVSGTSDQLALFRGGGQAMLALIGLAGAVVVVLRRRSFDVATREIAA